MSERQEALHTPSDEHEDNRTTASISGQSVTVIAIFALTWR